MQAIQTRYHAPTNSSGARISAKCSAKRIVLPWNYELDPAQNHKAAAEELILRLHWHRDHAPSGRPHPIWYTGGLDDGSMVHVCAWPDAAIDVSGEPARPYQPVR